MRTEGALAILSGLTIFRVTPLSRGDVELHCKTCSGATVLGLDVSPAILPHAAACSTLALLREVRKPVFIRHAGHDCVVRHLARGMQDQ